MKKIVEKRNKVNEYIIMLFSFLIFPMPTSVFCLFCGIKKRNKWDTWGGSVLLLSLINITIDWENTDYCWYIPLYKDALVTGFSDYMWSLNGAKEPVYTDEGMPFVTMTQDACKSYRGDTKQTPDTTCAECQYFRRGEDWIGICLCPKNKKL